MKFISFNINGLRAHFHQLEAIIYKYKPEIICLQETKVSDDMFPYKKINELGYYVFFYGQKSYYGVAILTKKKPFRIIKGLPFDKKNTQTRVIILNFLKNQNSLFIINCYSPQGENRNNKQKFSFKKEFYKNLLDYIVSLKTTKSQILVMGDMNISYSDLDIGISISNRNRWLKMGKCSFLPEERKWLSNLFVYCELIDTYREKNPYINTCFSWFDYRSKGFENNFGLRIDLILSCKKLAKYCTGSGIYYDIREMKRPSDHAPIWSDFNLVDYL